MSSSTPPKPERLRLSTIQERVEEFRNRFIENVSEVPVKIEDLIERKLGIEIRPEIGLMDNGRSEAFLSNDLKTIIIDSGRYYGESFEKRTRFTLAHELGHLVLHEFVYHQFEASEYKDWIDFINSIEEDDLDWFEMQADEFAGRLLVPKEELLSEVETLHPKIDQYIKVTFKDPSINHDETSVEEYVKKAVGRMLSERFLVSSTVIEVRLKRERIFEELGIEFKKD